MEQVAVTAYAAEGKAIAKQDGKVYFIEGAVPGDVVDAFISTNKKDYGEGKVTKIHQYSSERVSPFCRHFGICGGCKWQMLPYAKQLEYKQQEVEQHFKRIAKLNLPEIQPIIGSERTEQYRNKLEFTFSNKRYLTQDEIASEVVVGPENALGYHAPRIFDKVIDIHECHLMYPVNNLIRNTVREYAKEAGLTYYDIRLHTGFLRNIIIRNCNTGELMVNICLGYEDDAATKALLDHLLSSIPDITTLLYTINLKWNDSIYDLSPVVYHGKGYVEEKLEDYRFNIGPKSFFQTNTLQAEQLYRITREFAELSGKETVYDLYCGTGSIGIFLSSLAARVVGVEVVEEAIADAKINAQLNGIEHAQFFAGDVIKVCDDTFFETHGRPDVVITDPPRAGMHEKLVLKLLEMEAPLIVYVSCNTATQARDLALLGEKYRVEKIQPVDMFPHTHHIECVVQLKLIQ